MIREFPIIRFQESTLRGRNRYSTSDATASSQDKGNYKVIS
jgi:hypothetical protein